ncbi:efflux transporter periplasmic adaptor subunit [Stutzerimonas stutzeri]|uniref:Efflux transporter periplasmic adaptor subunit n=1 Tax=Stutzerimonas stutzeri TaxID=316 RepID=A0A2N8SPS5_STUST|nr:HlyD family secretion protein [Stutzerimonas stutzeri]MCQ4327506.1 HlyD family secretion protein [Stutzerimonas stutzeri]PNG04497.1 efflux transporter periplasmic adaptor subunit [Stutzerimonas stutzeri]
MNKWIPAAGSVVLTLLAVAIAVVVSLHLWDYYMEAPWTRDGHVHADIIQVAPDVSGLVTELHVRDNQKVEHGQVLFVIDRARFELAVAEARAALLERQAQLEQARREAKRNRVLKDLIAAETVEIGDTRVKRAEAALATAEAALGVARLNLERTTVRSPVDGYLSDQTMRVGDYVKTGTPVLSIVDTRSLRVEGYFEETKLHAIDIGQPVEIRVMGESQHLRGHVQSIAAGIEDRDRARGKSLLPNIDPSFNWVRLAQRIPVRVVLDDGQQTDIRLIVGRTATLSVLPWPAAATKPATP